MTGRTPLVITVGAFATIGAVVLAQIGGADAVIGPSLAAIVSTLFVLVRSSAAS